MRLNQIKIAAMQSFFDLQKWQFLTVQAISLLVNSLEIRKDVSHINMSYIVRQPSGQLTGAY